MINELIAEILEDPFIKRSQDMMMESFAALRRAKKLSLVHDEVHEMATTTYAGVVAAALADVLGIDQMFRRSTVYCAMAAGLWHDIIREAQENEPHGPRCEALLMNRHVSMGFSRSTHELTVIAEAIRLHEGSLKDKLDYFGDPVDIGTESANDLLRSIVGIALKIADGCLEASGHRVVERRAFFVGRERMIHGDLNPILSYPDEADLAVIGESLIRLWKKLAIAEYPKWLRPLGESLHAIQYWFLAGLLWNRNITAYSAAEDMLERSFPKFDVELVTKIGSEDHFSSTWFRNDKYPTLSQAINEIRNTWSDKDSRKLLSAASSQVVDFISQADTPEGGIVQLRECAAGDGSGNNWVVFFSDGISGYRDTTAESMESVYSQIVEGVRCR